MSFKNELLLTIKFLSYNIILRLSNHFYKIGTKDLRNKLRPYKFKSKSLLPFFIEETTKLKLGHSSTFTDNKLGRFVNLKSLVLDDNNDITDASVGLLTGLTHLKINDCLITNEGVKPLINLKLLDIGNTDITDEAIFLLTNLESLRVEGGNVTDAGILPLKNLSKLYLNNCTGITDTGISFLKKLTYMEIYGDTNLTIEGVKSLPMLKKFKKIDSQFNIQLDWTSEK